MKSILLFANEDAGFEARLQAALDVARAFDAHLTCLQVTPHYAFVMADPFGGIYALSTVVDEIRTVEEAHRDRLQERLNREGVSWEWLHQVGQPAQIVVERSRLADLIVLGLVAPTEPRSGTPLSITADVAVHARGPVLAVPPAQKGLDCSGPAAVAWNGSAEAAHALRFALPLLAKASAVHLVTVSDDKAAFSPTDASRYLARHGIVSELHAWPREGRPVAEAVRDAAATLGARYVVMGAYGHSRIREAVLGGVTAEMLEDAPLPLLLGH